MNSGRNEKKNDIEISVTGEAAAKEYARQKNEIIKKMMEDKEAQVLTGKEKEEFEKLMNSQTERGKRVLALKNDTDELSKLMMPSIYFLGKKSNHEPTEQEINVFTERAKAVNKTMSSLNDDETAHCKQLAPLEKKLQAKGSHAFFKEFVDTDKEMSDLVSEQIQKTQKVLAGVEQVKSRLKK